MVHPPLVHSILDQGELSHVCLPCVASRITRRQESWRLSDAARCALQLATHLFGPLFWLDGWLDQGSVKSIGWSNMARVKQALFSRQRIGPATAISTVIVAAYISSLPLWLLGDFEPNYSFPSLDSMVNGGVRK